MNNNSRYNDSLNKDVYMARLSGQHFEHAEFSDKMAEVYTDFLVKMEELEKNTALDDAARDEIFCNVLQEEFKQKLQDLRKHGL